MELDGKKICYNTICLFACRNIPPYLHHCMNFIIINQNIFIKTKEQISRLVRLAALE